MWRSFWRSSRGKTLETHLGKLVEDLGMELGQQQFGAPNWVLTQHHYLRSFAPPSRLRFCGHPADPFWLVAVLLSAQLDVSQYAAYRSCV